MKERRIKKRTDVVRGVYLFFIVFTQVKGGYRFKLVPRFI